MKLKSLLFAATTAIGLALNAQQTESLELTFNRVGTEVQDVITSTNMPGVAAQLVESNHQFKATAGNVTSSILCPNVNGNTDPTITMTFLVANLPSTFKYDEVALDIHALNGGNGYQMSDDDKIRQYNVEVLTGNSLNSLEKFASFDDIDIAADVNPGESSRNQVWNMEMEESKAATSPMFIQLKITKGTMNEGCFFGLSSLALISNPSTAIDVVETENTNAPVEYFNMQGERVPAENIANGLYIVRNGSKVQKILVK